MTSLLLLATVFRFSWVRCFVVDIQTNKSWALITMDSEVENLPAGILEEEELPLDIQDGAAKAAGQLIPEKTMRRLTMIFSNGRKFEF